MMHVMPHEICLKAVWPLGEHYGNAWHVLVLLYADEGRLCILNMKTSAGVVPVQYLCSIQLLKVKSTRDNEQLLISKVAFAFIGPPLGSYINFNAVGKSESILYRT